MREFELREWIDELMSLVKKKDIEIRDLEITVANLRLDLDVVTGDYERMKVIIDEQEELIEALSREADKLYTDNECLKTMNELKAPAPVEIPILVYNKVLKPDETLDDVLEKQCSRGW